MSSQPKTPVPHAFSYAQVAKGKHGTLAAATTAAAAPPRHADAPLQTPHNAAKDSAPLQTVKERLIAAMLAMGDARTALNKARAHHERTFAANDASTSGTATVATNGYAAMQRHLAATLLARCEREFEQKQQEYMAAKRERDAFDAAPLAPLAPLSPVPPTRPEPSPLVAVVKAAAAAAAAATPPPPRASGAVSSSSTPALEAVVAAARAARDTVAQAPPRATTHNEWRSVLSLLARYNKKPLEAFLQQCNVLDLDELDPSATAPADAVPVLSFANWLAQRVRCNVTTIANAMRDSLSLLPDTVGGGDNDDAAALHRLATRAAREMRSLTSRHSQWQYVRAVTTRIYEASNDNDANPLQAFRRLCVNAEAMAPDNLDMLWLPVLQGMPPTEAHGSADDCGLFVCDASATAERVVALAMASLNEILTTTPTEEWENAHVFTCTTMGASPVVHIFVPFGFKAVLRVRLFALDFSTTNGVVDSIYNMLAMFQVINYKLEQGHFAPLRVTNETCGHDSCHSAAHNLHLVPTSMLHTFDMETGLMHVLTKRDGWRAPQPQRTPEPTLGPHQQFRTATTHTDHTHSHVVYHAHAAPLARSSPLARTTTTATTTTTTVTTKSWADWNADSDDDNDMTLFK